ncbi:MAG: DUF4331 family protein, partial [Gaiellaceae bacterium]
MSEVAAHDEADSPAGRLRFGRICGDFEIGPNCSTASGESGRPTAAKHAQRSSRKEQKMRKLGIVLAAALAVAALAAAFAVRGAGPKAASASSHREAPLVSQDPTADNTDLYAFVSPDKPDTATIISNWIPFEDPAGGPMWYRFDPSARYDIYVDRNGDGKP